MVLSLNNRDEHDDSAKKALMCPKCKISIQPADRVSRGWLVKYLLFWMPLKRYICYRCNRKYYFKR